MLKNIAFSLLTVMIFFVDSISQEKERDTIGSSKITPAYIAAIEEAQNIADSLRVLNLDLKSQIGALKAAGGVTKVTEKFAFELLSVAKWLLIFSFLLILSILIFLFHTHKEFGSFAFQIIGLIVVVNASLFMILTGYDKDQITPIVGLLGTIVGFIFGSNLNAKSAKTENGPKE
ncbi:hypothetical protein [Dyadobacter sp. CY356]|uniref:hypothetical protein n=1 Tax=Dyadobacter sp. CY356 TaxID=2906442 RepID=UPI001F45BCAB|nr:hypothetical protein [Dyadobacter sp. CY356]MCF0055364.1 hypothetical protein [Dyadobacter sp. CY356]